MYRQAGENQMGFFHKLFTAFRGIASEAGETIIDTQAIRILEQEVRDAKKHWDEAKENLAKVVAEQIGIEREVKRFKQTIAEYEEYAIQSLDKGNEALATEIAEKVADLENELAVQLSVLESYHININTLKQNIRNTELHIKSMEREISVVKTTESVQKANIAAANKFSGSNSALRSATDSLERIKQKQQQKADQLKAAMELQQQESGSDLHEKLKQAGLISEAISTQTVLARLKTKQRDKINMQL